MLLAFVLGVLAALWLWGHSWRRPRPEPPEEPPPPEPEPARAVPDLVPAASLPALLSPRLAGPAADGARVDEPAQPDAVVWVDHGDEVIVYLDSLKIEVASGVLLCALDLETDQTGRATVVVPFALARTPGEGITLVTEGRVRGPSVLVHRWGEAVQEAAYAAIVDLSETHAEERGARPGSVYLADGGLRFDVERDA